MQTFRDILQYVEDRRDYGKPVKRGAGLVLQDKIGLRDYSNDRGPVPYDGFPSGHVDQHVARIFSIVFVEGS